MDKEILRKQIFDEVHVEFESKLREAKRQKSQAETELEAAAERWRAERRRLNSEIDRLETSLADAKDTRKKTVARGRNGVDPAEVAKFQAAAEEKLQKASAEWETERAELRKEITRLERALAELLERSNNPLRTTIPHKEQLETRLEAATRAKEQVEQDFQLAKAVWEEEREKLSKGPAQSERELKKVRGEWESEQKKLTGEIAKLRDEAAGLKRQAAEAAQTASRQETSNTAVGQQLREALQRVHFLEQELAAANETIASIRATQSDERTSLEEQLAAVEADLKLQRSQAVQGEVVEQLRKQYDERLNAIAREKTQLAEKLQEASALLETERSRFAAAAAATAVAAPAASSRNGSEGQALSVEIERVEHKIADISRLIDDPASELSTVIRKNVERAELDAYLKGILFSMGRGKGL
jgi:chromosome segregation ATPase